jgi:hypothetical protein
MSPPPKDGGGAGFAKSSSLPGFAPKGAPPQGDDGVFAKGKGAPPQMQPPADDSGFGFAKPKGAAPKQQGDYGAAPKQQGDYGAAPKQQIEFGKASSKSGGEDPNAPRGKFQSPIVEGQGGFAAKSQGMAFTPKMAPPPMASEQADTGVSAKSKSLGAPAKSQSWDGAPMAKQQASPDGAAEGWKAKEGNEESSWGSKSWDSKGSWDSNKSWDSKEWKSEDSKDWKSGDSKDWKSGDSNDWKSKEWK